MFASRLRRWLRLGAGLLLATLILLVLVEGLASLAYFAFRLSDDSQPALAERSHTRYDEQLGWVNEPNVTVQNLYGPGIDLHTNGQGFRATQDFTRKVRPGQVRVICSGDSFTLGFGVGDGETWCAQLSATDPRLETVNMGQGGYGVDQAYLWYLRDSGVVEHDLHLFAFIYDDFVRMTRDRFLGYGKPVLTLEAGELRVANVPVPRKGYRVPWFTQNAELFDELRSFAAFRRLVRRMSRTDSRAVSLGQAVDVALAAFARLAEHHRQRGSTLVLVYLPVEEDYSAGAFDELRARLASWAARNDVAYIDLVEDFRALSPERAARVFIPEGESAFPDAAGHYSRAGSRVIAELLQRRLAQQPSFVERLAQATGATGE